MLMASFAGSTDAAELFNKYKVTASEKYWPLVFDHVRWPILTFVMGPLVDGHLDGLTQNRLEDDGTSNESDCVYVLTVSGIQITDETGQHLDGNGDGIGGDDYISPTTGPNRIFRLFGDSDGDGDVDAIDFTAFRRAIGTGPSIFDFDNDGDTDLSDFVQFRLRFGTMLP